MACNSSAYKLTIEDTFKYVNSCDLDDVQLEIKVGSLEGTLGPSFSLSKPEKSDLKIKCEILSSGQLICPAHETSYKHWNQHQSRWTWSEWMVFPIRICDLPRDAIVRAIVYDCKGPNEVTAIGATSLSLFSKHATMRKGMYDLKLWPYDAREDGPLDKFIRPGKSCNSERIYSLDKTRKKYDRGQIMKVEWLDKLTFPEIERMKEKERKQLTEMHVSLEFPRFSSSSGISVLYSEKDADQLCHLPIDCDLIVVPDPEISLDNLAENKHHRLSRSIRSGVCDRDLKPNPQTRDLLNLIVNYPSTKQLTSEEQDLIWKFRFYLINQKKALAKFLKSLNWEAHSEASQAIELLPQWSPMDIGDALELLSPQFTHPSVRRYAVSRLKEAPDEDLLLYLLQLVQALRYENFNFDDVSLQTFYERDDCQTLKEDCDLTTFLIFRATNNFTLANYFYWYLNVEMEEHKPAEKTSDQIPSESRTYKLYLNVQKRFKHRLEKKLDSKQGAILMERQRELVEELVNVMREVVSEKGDRIKKIERLRSRIRSKEPYNLRSFDPLPLPLDPDVRIKAILPDKATLFKSALMPSRLSFLTVDDLEYVAIFKFGDDLRQDQLILQTITLIDKLLRKENLDLKLTPYRVLATSSRHGFVQFIDSVSVAEVLKNYNDSIQKFFRSHFTCENAPYGISPEVMDTYVKSCAGYCIITYLLGVGDRHLDNLLLTKNGNLFHIDFGYILGRDPKPFPPPMKLSREMVEAMGGVNSDHYQQFRKFCYTAFLHLRRNANLILNLFTLMVDATIPDIASEPDKTVKKVQDKFRLDLTEEEAVHFIQGLIEESATAVMASFVEQVHRFAQYWRK